MTRIVGLQRHMGKLIATPREIICFHQQEPTPQSPVMKIVPSFPPSSVLPLKSPTLTPKELVVSIYLNVPH